MSKYYRIYYISRLKYRDRDRYLCEKIDEVGYLESYSREDVIARMNTHLHEMAEVSAQKIRKDNENEHDLKWLSESLVDRIKYCEYTEIEVIDGIFEYDDEVESSDEIENYNDILAQKLRAKINASLLKISDQKRLVEEQKIKERRDMYDRLKEEFGD